MPAPAVGPTVKTILRQALALEVATVGAGDTFLGSIQTQLISTATAGGLKMISASTAGKAFTFADGWSTTALAEALDEAYAIWNTLDSEQLSALLNARPVRVARATFAGRCY